MDPFQGLDMIGDQALLALLATQVIEILKRSKYFPWLQAHQKTALRVLNVTSGALISAGVVWSWSPDIEGRLVIDGLTWANLLTFGKTWAAQMGFQQGAYALLFDRASQAIRARQVVYVERGAERGAVQKAAADAVSRAVAEAFEAAGHAMSTPNPAEPRDHQAAALPLRLGL